MTALAAGAGVGRVAAAVKAALAGLDPAAIEAMLVRHYREWRLLDGAGRWVTAALTKAEDRLRPPGLDRAALERFVDAVARLAAANPYLAGFLDQVVGADRVDEESESPRGAPPGEDGPGGGAEAAGDRPPFCQAGGARSVRAWSLRFPVLAARLATEGTRVLPDVVTFAWALEALTRLMAEDWRFLAFTLDHWRQGRRFIWGSKNFRLFDHVKLLSIEHLNARFVECHRRGVVPPDFMRVLLPLNILEAVAWEIVEGYPGNARAGLTLARYPPGAPRENPATGEGPSIWTADRRAILLRTACPRAWSDLYTSWNLAFVSQYDTFPYVMCKLLVPSVLGYAAQPAAYIYYRCLAIHALMNYAYLGDGGPERSRITDLIWRDHRLTRAWSRHNRRCARQYEETVARAVQARP
ncbi:MAG: hypothetical protein OZSIB_0060 [Candidatus Ozemobacter sibiricus]|jgi:hypothetical protein|uniref:Uncharacterized protein n=1 Tax=Candidatus Ozemobacter sibiricus TaxID=2268124 RepID=A0A367ZMZ6_9BACT|nr:MAG: hypothetical protein OZSIB_0060 [Candidatus Ozemobacter sibiricus]